MGNGRSQHAKYKPEITIPRAIPRTTPGTIPNTTPWTIPNTTPGTIPKITPGTIPETTPKTIPKTTPFKAPPVPFTDQADFMQNWFNWRKRFLKFVTGTEQDKKKHGNMLLNCIGPIGQEIHCTLSFVNPRDKDNLDVLLTKFDIYCIFSTKTRKRNENVYQYIKDLNIMTETKGITDQDKYVKEKIMTEIPINEFKETAKTLIPNFVLSSNFKGLTLTEIAFIWELGEKKRSCKECGDNHGLNHCRAKGKHCHKCKKPNHLANVCPENLINDCVHCGGMHCYRQCPAYNTVCSKCGRQNHFSWRCRTQRIQNCNYCGQDHIASRSECMANETICSKCKTKGHISAKCHWKLHAHRR